MVRDCPTVKFDTSLIPTRTTGERLPPAAPLTSKLISAVRPPGSRAVTVILAAPVVNACTAVIVSVLPEIDARTKSVWFERAL